MKTERNLEALRQDYTNSHFWTSTIKVKLSALFSDVIGKRRIDVANQLGVSRSAVTQMLYADGDQKISTMVKTAISLGYVPHIEFVELDRYLRADITAMDSMFDKCYRVNAVELWAECQVYPIQDESTATEPWQGDRSNTQIQVSQTPIPPYPRVSNG